MKILRPIIFFNLGHLEKITLIRMACLLSLILLNACSSFRTVSPSELVSRNLVGEWQSESGSHLSIYCSGEIDYEIKGYISYIGNTQGSCTGCSIKEIQPDQLILGPIIKTTFKVSKWPYKEDKTVRMVAEETVWTKETERICAQ